MKDHLARQYDILPEQSLSQPITIIGAGAIGSFVVLSLAKMGFRNITVYDFDEVSVENMNCQWYRFADIGKAKVLALHELIYDFTQMRIVPINEKFVDQELTGIVISAVDSMAVRQTIWNKVRGNPDVKWIIDPRMASEYALSYVMDPCNEADQISYAKTLYTDENAIQEPCTHKAIMYTATMISGHVAKHVKDLVTNKPYARVTNWDIAMNKQNTWGKAAE